MANAQGSGAGFDRLESLSISGFRGIGQLTIPRLGRVTLIAGKNGVGKTTVLDAVRLYIAGGQYRALRSLLRRRGELTSARNDDGELVDTVALDRLFYRVGDVHSVVEIGPVSGGPKLRIEEESDYSTLPDGLLADIDADDFGVLRVDHGGTCSFFLWPSFRMGRSPIWRNQRVALEQAAIPTRCEWLGPGLPDNSRLARFWDEVVLTEDEEFAADALRLVFGRHVERAAVVGRTHDSGVKIGSGRRVVVKLTDHPRPVPLRSLGDGATRMFSVALALANCRNGILLIDEVENGIHYSLQSKFWSMILQAAEAHNTQVLATTHSKDCINGFAAAAIAHPNIEGNLFRIGRRNGELRAVGYSKEQLEVAAEQNIEVR